MPVWSFSNQGYRRVLMRNKNGYNDRFTVPIRRRWLCHLPTDQLTSSSSEENKKLSLRKPVVDCRPEKMSCRYRPHMNDDMCLCGASSSSPLPAFLIMHRIIELFYAQEFTCMLFRDKKYPGSVVVIFKPKFQLPLYYY